VNIPSELVTSIGESLLDLGLGGLGGVGDHALLHLVGEILAAGVRHVCWLIWLVWGLGECSSVRWM